MTVIKVGCVACEKNRCQVHGVLYHCVLVCLADKTFSIEIVQSNKELPLKEDLGLLGFGHRFRTQEEQEDFITYLEHHNFTLVK